MRAVTSTLSSPKAPSLPDYLREATAWLQLATPRLIQLRVPVVTAVQGFAAGGGGLGLVCASDIVVAARSAKFFSGAVRVGMAPDGGSSVTLTQLVGLRQALRILLTNPTLTATEALRDRVDHRDVADDELPSRANKSPRLWQLTRHGTVGHETSGLERDRRIGRATVGRRGAHRLRAIRHRRRTRGPTGRHRTSPTEIQRPMTTTTADPVLVEDGGAVRTVTLNRPDKRNAIDIDCASRLPKRSSPRTPIGSIRAIVLTGAGSAFCSGGDIASMNGCPPNGPLNGRSWRRRVIRAIWNTPKPVVAAVEGSAYGAGTALAAACDRVVAARDARFATTFTNVGLAGDMGISLRCRHGSGSRGPGRC